MSLWLLDHVSAPFEVEYLELLPLVLVLIASIGLFGYVAYTSLIDSNNKQDVV
ncbi:MAG: hypothetical protein HRU25_10590 [Psychrobium sp.]|nr:hypothetical protein [Psychrobium sp.]